MRSQVRPAYRIDSDGDDEAHQDKCRRCVLIHKYGRWASVLPLKSEFVRLGDRGICAAFGLRQNPPGLRPLDHGVDHARHLCTQEPTNVLCTSMRVVAATRFTLACVHVHARECACRVHQLRTCTSIESKCTYGKGSCV